LIKQAEEKKISKEFEFSTDGKDQIVAWLNEEYESNQDLWN